MDCRGFVARSRQSTPHTNSGVAAAVAFTPAASTFLDSCKLGGCALAPQTGITASVDDDRPVSGGNRPERPTHPPLCRPDFQPESAIHHTAVLHPMMQQNLGSASRRICHTSSSFTAPAPPTTTSPPCLQQFSTLAGRLVRRRQVGGCFRDKMTAELWAGTLPFVGSTIAGTAALSPRHAWGREAAAWSTTSCIKMVTTGGRGCLRGHSC